MTRMQNFNDSGVEMRDSFIIHDPVDLDCQVADDGMTRQEFADECDINVLMQRYEKSGVITHYSAAEPQYLDLSDVPDLHAALSVLDAAQAAFMTLPATVRREFDNDPVQFADFAANPDNLEKMREWGLAPPAPVPEPPIKVEITNPPSADQSAP